MILRHWYGPANSRIRLRRASQIRGSQGLVCPGVMREHLSALIAPISRSFLPATAV